MRELRSLFKISWSCMRRFQRHLWLEVLPGLMRDLSPDILTGAVKLAFFRQAFLPAVGKSASDASSESALSVWIRTQAEELCRSVEPSPDLRPPLRKRPFYGLQVIGVDSFTQEPVVTSEMLRCHGSSNLCRVAEQVMADWHSVEPEPALELHGRQGCFAGTTRTQGILPT